MKQAHDSDPSDSTVCRVGLVNTIDPNTAVETFPVSLITVDGFEAVKLSDFVFGCVDKEGPRLVLAELCAAYKKGLFDIATDIEVQDQPRYGGRVCTALNGDGCPLCLGVLDSAEAGIDLGPAAVREQRDRIYGVDRSALGVAGPSVISINGAVASLAVTEFMLEVTSMRHAKRLITYRADLGRVTVSGDAPMPGCFICKGLWGRGEAAGLERKYLGAGGLS